MPKASDQEAIAILGSVGAPSHSYIYMLQHVAVTFSCCYAWGQGIHCTGNIMAMVTACLQDPQGLLCLGAQGSLCRPRSILWSQHTVAPSAEDD